MYHVPSLALHALRYQYIRHAWCEGDGGRNENEMNATAESIAGQSLIYLGIMKAVFTLLIITTCISVAFAACGFDTVDLSSLTRTTYVITLSYFI